MDIMQYPKDVTEVEEGIADQVRSIPSHPFYQMRVWATNSS